MTLQEKAELDSYEKVADIDATKRVALVCNKNNQQFYVKKEIHDYNLSVYHRLKDLHASWFPEIVFLAEEGGVLYLVEEYVEGLNLEQIVETQGVMHQDEVKYLMLDLCDALNTLHRQHPPIIHRDIKASNVIRCTDGSIKLIDFNTARLFGSETSQDTRVLGTRGYAPPEQYGYRQTDQRSDIYALGVLMNYLLTGEYPSVKLYHGEAKHIIQKCTEFDPGKRYRHVYALIHDLEKVSEAYPRQRKGNVDKPYQNGNVAPGVIPEDTPKRNPDTTIARKKGFWYVPALPPGFRTGRIWKMIISTCGYLFIAFAGITLQATDGQGNPLPPIGQWENKIGLWFMWYLSILLVCNYGNIHDKLPLTRSNKIGVRIIGCVIYTLIILFVVEGVVVILNQ